ncbi:MAG TPA: S41 family peptidase [Chryseosolibacter sp.]
MKLMKAVILVVALFIILALATQARSQGQPEMNRVVETAIAHAKELSVNSAEVDWENLSLAMREAAKGAKSVAELKRTFDILFAELKDRNALFYQTSTKTIIAKAESQSTTASDAKFYFTMLDNNVCYLRLVAMEPGTSIQKQVAEVRQAIDSLAKDDALQWIVDLRYATGGDNQTLLASVAPLLDEGLVVTAVDNHKKIKNMYTVHNGNLYVDQKAITRFPLWTKDMRKARIAVLTSQQTSGAAELLAVGLKGRKHSRIFGEATAGYNYGLIDTEVASNISMRLSHLRYVDRKGNDYRERITPDVEVKATHSNNLSDDRVVAEAKSWLVGVQDSPIALGMN